MMEKRPGKQRSWKRSFCNSKEFKLPTEIKEPISVELSLDEKTHQAGSRIHGSISMFVPNSATGCTDFSWIHLSLEGNESIDAQSNSAGIELFVGQDTVNFVTLDKEVVLFSSPLVEGRHEYSFEWTLPDSLPSSMRCAGQVRCATLFTTSAAVADDENDPSICEVKYTLKAYLLASSPRPKFPVTSRKEAIQITAAPDNRAWDHDEDGGFLFELKTFKMKSFWRKKGSIEYGLDTDTLVASPGSDIIVGITGRNMSSLPVNKLLVQWVETVRWGQNYDESASRRILAETTVAGSNLPPSWKQKRKQKQNQVGLSSIPADRIERRLRLDNSARNSYSGQIIEVRHSLEVTAVTSCTHSPNKKVTILVEV